MKLSIIIPTYNRKETLKKQLILFKSQKNIEFLDFEIIVVDDGSSDETKEMIDNLELNYEIKYIFLKRNIDSSRARARNVGSKKSTGDILSFIDSGILPSESFIQDTINYYSDIDNNNKVLLHYTYGLFATNDDIYKESKSHNDFIEIIKKNDDWRDVREDIFDHISEVPAPWSLGWSCMMSVTKEKFNIVRGFNESFKNWGGEDSEFALKLYQNSCEFVFQKQIFGIHLPHAHEEKHSINLKVKSSQTNRMKIYRLHPNIQTELYTIFPSQILNQFINMIDNITVGQMIVNSYSQDCLKSIKKEFSKQENSLLVGIDNHRQILEFSPSDVFFFNRTSFRLFQKEGIVKHHVFGIQTIFEDQHFDYALVSDFLRILPKTLLKKMITELYRISSRLFMVYSKDHKSTFVQIFDCPWHDNENLNVILSELDLKLEIVESMENEIIYEITDLRGWFSGNTSNEK
jgi:glycosyltransferase involved in cell wall biosynthesis